MAPAARHALPAGRCAPPPPSNARSRFIQAQAFLTWTDALGVQPSALTQAHIDAYYAGHASHQREGVRAFLVWAAGHGHIPGHLDIPRQQPYAGQVITQQRRLDLLCRFATDEAIPVRPRAAACRHPPRPRPRQLRQRLAVPSRHAGQPAAYRPMAAQLREHGLPLRTARISALRQLVLQVPAPVIAGALGFHHTTTTTRQHVKAGGPWSQYAGGDREP